MMAVFPKIAAISFLNSIPFVYGIRHASRFGENLILSTPNETERIFREAEADIALVPSVVVPALKGAELITDYCIGASGEVRTVVLVSNCELSEIERIWADSHSKTSVQLAGYLAQNCWKISPEWLELSDYRIMQNPKANDAFLLIGDKVFEWEKSFKYKRDCAQDWHEATHLPFAFAVWVGKKGLPYEIYDELEEALTFGMEHIYESVLESPFEDKILAYNYLTTNIDFFFDSKKHESLKKFWSYGIKIRPKVEPG